MLYLLLYYIKRKINYWRRAYEAEKKNSLVLEIIHDEHIRRRIITLYLNVKWN